MMFGTFELLQIADNASRKKEYKKYKIFKS